MSRDFELITLRNGERAVRHLSSGEVMHPSVGPWREANLLYVDQTHLRERLMSPRAGPVRVWDVGLGAGSNAVAALTAASELGDRRQRRLEVISFDVTTDALALALGDPEGFVHLAPWRGAAQALMNAGRWEGAGMSWQLYQGALLEQLQRAPLPASLVFFDPFSPETNPTLWTPEALARLRAVASDSDEGTLLVTYSASTRTRVSLLLAGFFVGTGVPVGGRQETTVAATRLDLLAAPLGARWLERWRRSDAPSAHGQDARPDLPSHPQFVAAVASPVAGS